MGPEWVRGIASCLQPTVLVVRCLPPLWGGSCLENWYQGLRSFTLAYPWLISLHASGVRSCFENWYQGLRSFALAYPWLISLHASGVTQSKTHRVSCISKSSNQTVPRVGSS